MGDDSVGSDAILYKDVRIQDGAAAEGEGSIDELNSTVIQLGVEQGSGSGMDCLGEVFGDDLHMGAWSDGVEGNDDQDGFTFPSHVLKEARRKDKLSLNITPPLQGDTGPTLTAAMFLKDPVVPHSHTSTPTNPSRRTVNGRTADTNLPTQDGLSTSTSILTDIPTHTTEHTSNKRRAEELPAHDRASKRSGLSNSLSPIASTRHSPSGKSTTRSVPLHDEIGSITLSCTHRDITKSNPIKLFKALRELDSKLETTQITKGPKSFTIKCRSYTQRQLLLQTQRLLDMTVTARSEESFKKANTKYKVIIFGVHEEFSLEEIKFETGASDVMRIKRKVDGMLENTRNVVLT
jgi:hypothetical protein